MHNENGTTPSCKNPELNCKRFSGRNRNNEYFISCSANDNTNEPCLKVMKCVLRSFQNQDQKLDLNEAVQVHCGQMLPFALIWDQCEVGFHNNVQDLRENIWSQSSTDRSIYPKKHAGCVSTGLFPSGIVAYLAHCPVPLYVPLLLERE